MPDTPTQATQATAATQIHKPPILEARKLGKIYNPGTPKAYEALQDINFTIEDRPDLGEFVAIIGPSGCGKSTLINMIAGFDTHLPPTAGELLLHGKPVTGPGIDRGMIFQKYSSFPHRTVLQNVRFGLELNQDRLKLSAGDMNDMAREWVARVGLAGHEHKYPAQLSGGQQQRVAIARTLILRPEIILLDEPFSALDEPTRLDMQKLLIDLWYETQCTVLMITHSITEAVFLCERLWIFTNGPGTIAREIRDVIPPSRDMLPMQAQEKPEFLDAVRIIAQEFQQVTEG